MPFHAMCHVSHVTFNLSPTPTATATDPPPAPPAIPYFAHTAVLPRQNPKTHTNSKKK